MTDQVPQATQLAANWDSLLNGCHDAIDWIQDNRAVSKRLNNEADALVLKCRRVRNRARRLGQAAVQPVTVGFFGLSQAGKSYLISSLAAGSNGKLETQLGAQQLDFLQHVNPPGGGKEATGLVTRFTRHAEALPTDFPLELALFSEADVIKILANAFFNDFNTEKFQYHYDEQKIRQTLTELAGKRAPAALPGMVEDDVVQLWDYLQDRFTSSMRELGGYFWPAAIELAPGLSIPDRARLFSLLWGEIAELTAVYQEFAETLAQLGYAQRIFAPLSALVEELDNGEFSQSNSIMNVDMLERLGTPRDSQVEVSPFVDGKVQAPVSVSRARLAALTVELKFSLKEPPRHAMFEQVDLLDFPGYRGRLDVESLDDVKRAVKSDDANPVAQLVLRGKVAYLFERYTDSQSMNLLIVCTASHKQSDVTSLGPALTEWIHKTQGQTATIRQSHKCGLLWAITMFDMRIQSSLSHSEDMLAMGWSGMIKMAMLERFGQCEWMQQWGGDQAFNNTFLVRKPGIDVPFIVQKSEQKSVQNSDQVAEQPEGEENGGKEQNLAQKYRDNLALMLNTFLQDDSVQRHVGEAQQAWEAMLALNDGGIARLASYLSGVSSVEIKLIRLQEQLQELVHELANNRLGTYFVSEGAGEVEKKKQLAASVVEAMKKRWLLTGDLLSRLEPSPANLRSSYLRVTDLPATTPTSESEPEDGGEALFLGDSSFDFDEDFEADLDTASSAGGVQKDTEQVSEDNDFASLAIQEWIAHLRALPENEQLRSYLGLSKTVLEGLSDELICAIERLDLRKRLNQLLKDVEHQSGARREQLVERQVMTVNLFVSDFLATLAFSDLTAGEHTAASAQLAKAPAEGELPLLGETPLNYTKLFIRDWFNAFSQLVVGNAGHSAGQEITPQENIRLGEIINRIRGQA